MAVYITPRFDLKCRGINYRDCGKVATHEVQTSGTASYGKFCLKHAKERAKDLAKSLKMEFVA